MNTPAPAEKKKPILTVRPTFDAGMACVEAVPAALVGMTASTALLGTFVFILFSLFGLTKFVSGGAIFSTCFMLGIALTPAVYFELKKQALSRTGFNFYDTYFEFQEFRFFMTRQRGRVRYSDIADVSQAASVLQSLCKLSTVYIYVPNMQYQRNGYFSGVKIIDVPERSRLADQILDIIHAPAAKAASA